MIFLSSLLSNPNKSRRTSTLPGQDATANALGWPVNVSHRSHADQNTSRDLQVASKEKMGPTFGDTPQENKSTLSNLQRQTSPVRIPDDSGRVHAHHAHQTHTNHTHRHSCAYNAYHTHTSTQAHTLRGMYTHARTLTHHTRTHATNSARLK